VKKWSIWTAECVLQCELSFIIATSFCVLGRCEVIVAFKRQRGIRLFVLSGVAIGCWQSFDVPPATEPPPAVWPRPGPGASPLTLGLVRYILRAQLSRWVSLAGCQRAALLKDRWPLPSVIHTGGSHHTHTPPIRVCWPVIFVRGHSRTLCTCPRI